jgi:DNA-binding response OmpR family regulator
LFFSVHLIYLCYVNFSGDNAIQRAEVLLIKRETLVTDLAETLAKAGYIVQVANDFDDALNIIIEDHPCLVIVSWNKSTIKSDDIFMLFRLTTSLPIIVVGDKQYAVQMLENGADAFVAKNEMPGLLLAKIRSMLRRYVNDSGE